MLNRPALQSQDVQLADPPASIYTSWSDENFYLAFRLGGVTAGADGSSRNFVQYDHGRAWGEDLCEFLIQPIYIDNSARPAAAHRCQARRDVGRTASPIPAIRGNPSRSRRRRVRLRSAHPKNLAR